MKFKNPHVIIFYLSFLGIGFIFDNIVISNTNSLQASPDLVKREDAGNIIPREQIHIQILNANGVNGMAAKARKFLVDNGYEIVEIGNHDRLCNSSMIYDRVGNKSVSKNVAEMLGINKSFVFVKKDKSKVLHCTVILGLDYKFLKPYEDERP